MMRPATLDQWIQACAAAWGEICNGHNGACVERAHETYENAIARHAGRILVQNNLGRAKGPVPDEWITVLRSFADRTPCSSDGLVAGPYGIRLAVRNLRRGHEFHDGELTH